MTCEDQAGQVVSPKIINGNKAGSTPSELNFDESSGSLACTAGARLAVHGRVKFEGYEAQELLTAHAP
jgi:hypothetical protein